MDNTMPKNNDEWKEALTAEQYRILREKGTEPPMSGKLLHETRVGEFVCAGCNNPLFSSNTKFESGSGWPSFWDVVSEGNIKLQPDTSGGMDRVEAVCSKCGGHLGHLFDDGPSPTNQRYCINSASLNFKPKDDK
jgi:peptide-methionine (R)-S-oxide reductase